MRMAMWTGHNLEQVDLSYHAAKSLVLNALYGLKQRYVETGWSTKDPEEAFRALIDEEALFVFTRSHRVVCLTMCQPWFSGEDVLCEEFVDEGVSLEEVTELMEYVARGANVRRLVAGTRAAPKQRHAGLAKLYSKQGWSVSTMELTRVIDE